MVPDRKDESKVERQGVPQVNAAELTDDDLKLVGGGVGLYKGVPNDDAPRPGHPNGDDGFTFTPFKGKKP